MSIVAAIRTFPHTVMRPLFVTIAVATIITIAFTISSICFLVIAVLCCAAAKSIFTMLNAADSAESIHRGIMILPTLFYPTAIALAGIFCFAAHHGRSESRPRTVTAPCCIRFFLGLGPLVHQLDFAHWFAPQLSSQDRPAHKIP